MDLRTEKSVDRKGWPAGPWDEEPDLVEWRDGDLACLAVRERILGHWCGYVGVPPGHPWHGKGYNDVPAKAHGGLTFADACQEGGRICHVPRPGEPAEVWWLGFDCAHAHDTGPKQAANWLRGDWPGSAYRTLAYVRAEVADLAQQAREAAR